MSNQILPPFPDNPNPSPSNESEVKDSRMTRMTTPQKISATVTTIAEQLAEPNIELLSKVVGHLGTQKALALLSQTLELEAQGGQLIKSGQRRRTPGGVYFWLVKQQLSEEEHAALFPTKRRYPATPEGKKARQAAKEAALNKQVQEAWQSRHPKLAQLLTYPAGQAQKAKITLIGRPSDVRKHGTFIMTTMRAPKESPSLPKELPEPPPATLTYLIYMTRKQWKKVAIPLQNQQDHLIVAGYLTYDCSTEQLALFAQWVSTRNLQQAGRSKGRADA